MSSEVEAAGALATAGLAAGALEKSSGRTSAGHAHACANCATELAPADKFCSSCGQAAHVHRTLGHFIEEAFHGLFHFDTKAWRTLPLLAFRPGTLTHDYIHGRRARFISPLALFLFTVFLMFFVFALVGEVRVGENAPRTMAQLQAAVTSAQAEVAAAETELAKQKAALAALDSREAAGETLEPGARAGQAGEVAGAEGSLVGARASLESANAALKRRQERIALFEKARARLLEKEAEEKANPESKSLDEIIMSRGIIERGLADPNGPPDAVNVSITQTGAVVVKVTEMNEDGLNTIFKEIKAANAEGKIQVNTGNKKWDEKIRHKLDNPELAWYKIQNTAYKFSFLLVPISLPFIWLMFFWKRGVTLFDHTVFALYSLSFMSLVFVVLALLARAPEGILAGLVGAFGVLVAFGVPLHMFFQLKGGYRLGWVSALWRTGLMLIFAALSMLVFLASIFVLGLLG